MMTEFLFLGELSLYCSDKGQQEDWQTKIILEKINSSSEYEKTMQKS